MKVIHGSLPQDNDPANFKTSPFVGRSASQIWTRVSAAFTISPMRTRPRPRLFRSFGTMSASSLRQASTQHNLPPAWNTRA